ncbi:immunoglobulin-like domain-containing protein [Enterococcus faecium]|uniref:immunoglobulin-like domain-containing protein n=1 Tax=Enterococcus faecium TaxID=1352 RepID=UPI000BF18349|nr:immunoglobulin-like domain-containing protein [Enterococcus faecium]PEH49521.1 hypothetical protein CRM75_01840 [Enterococcus faecium]
MQQKNKITQLETYSILGGSWVTGLYEGPDVVRICLVINNQELSPVPLVNEGEIKYYAKDVITSTSQIVQVQIFDASGKVLDIKPLTVAE